MKSIEEIFTELDFEMSLTTSADGYCAHKDNLERKYHNKLVLEYYEALNRSEQECVWCDGHATNCSRYTE
jgi:hypothetical protein